MQTFLNLFRSHAQAENSANELYQRSRVARVGRGLIYTAAVLRVLRPALALTATTLFVALSLVSPATAQQGQSLLNGNANQPVDSIRTLVDIGVWVLLALGIGGIGWGIWNLMTDKAWGKQLVGGGAALGFGGIVSMINAIVNDDPITLPGL